MCGRAVLYESRVSGERERCARRPLAGQKGERRQSANEPLSEVYAYIGMHRGGEECIGRRSHCASRRAAISERMSHCHLQRQVAVAGGHCMQRSTQALQVHAPVISMHALPSYVALSSCSIPTCSRMRGSSTPFAL